MSDSSFFAMDFDGDHQFAFSRHLEEQMLDPPIFEVYLAGPLTNNNPVIDADCAVVRHTIKDLFGAYEYSGYRFHVYDRAMTESCGW